LRKGLGDVVRCFAAGDYGLSAGVAGVEPVSTDDAQHIRESIEGYGATLIELPDDAWRTSVAQWYGSHWDILVDLWTAEEGCSDLVLQGRVCESNGDISFRIHLVYVP
jgi:hypothetical protein